MAEQSKQVAIFFVRGLKQKQQMAGVFIIMLGDPIVNMNEHLNTASAFPISLGVNGHLNANKYDSNDVKFFSYI